MNVDFHVVSQTLQLMWQGMAAVFVVMMIIYIMILALYIGTHKKGKNCFQSPKHTVLRGFVHILYKNGKDGPALVPGGVFWYNRV